MPSDGQTDETEQFDRGNDPCSIVCNRCGTPHHIDAGGTQCRECRAFLPEPSRRQDQLFHKRMAETALAKDGYATAWGAEP